MRRLVLAAMMVGVAHSALAADLPDLPVLRGFVSDAPRNVGTNWQGFYVGGQAGFGNADMNFANTNNALIEMVAANPIFQQAQFPAFPQLGRVSTSKSTGFGGFFGYNAQWDNAVVGLDVSYLHATVKGSATADFETLSQQGASMIDTHTVDGQKVTEARYTPYSLRHFYASMLIAQNRDLKTIQERMGHEDAAMTLNVYGHLIRLKKAEEILEPTGILSSVLAA